MALHEASADHESRRLTRAVVKPAEPESRPVKGSNIAEPPRLCTATPTTANRRPASPAHQPAHREPEAHQAAATADEGRPGRSNQPAPHRLRRGAMPDLFGEIRAPSTLGSFLRSFSWGNVLQLGRVSRLLLAELAARAPLLPGKDVLAFVDIDSQQKRVYGPH